MNIELPDEFAPALKIRAQAQGLSPERYVRRVLEKELSLWEHKPPPTFRSGNEKAQAFEQWARNHRETSPLSDDAVSRANLVRQVL